MDMIALTALFAGKAAQIAALALVTIALGAFGVVAMRLRKGVVHTLDEATESVVNKFVIPKDDSSTTTSSTGGSSNSSTTNVIRTAQNIAGTVGTGAYAGNQVKSLIGGGSDNNDGSGGATGRIFGNGSGEEHQSVATGSGDTIVNQNNEGAEVNSSKSSENSSMSQNANSSLTNAADYDDKRSDSSKNIESDTDNNSKVDSDARSTTNGVATGGQYVTDGYMRDRSTRDVKEREDGKKALEYDSLASMSTKNVESDKVSAKGVEAGAAAHSVHDAKDERSVDDVNVRGVQAGAANGAAGQGGAAGVAGRAGMNGAAGTGGDSTMSATSDANVKGVAAVNGHDGRAGYGEAGASGQGGAAGAAGAGGAGGKVSSDVNASVKGSSSNQSVRDVQASTETAAAGYGAAGQGGAAGVAGRNGASAHAGAMNMNVNTAESQSRNVRVASDGRQGSSGVSGLNEQSGVSGAAGRNGTAGQFGSGAMVRDRSARAQYGHAPQGMYPGVGGAGGQSGKAGQSGAAGGAGAAGRNGANGVDMTGMYRQRAGSGSGAGTSYVPNRYGQGRPGSQNRGGRPGTSSKPYDPSGENGSRGVGPVGGTPSGTGAAAHGAGGHYQPRNTQPPAGTYRNKS